MALCTFILCILVHPCVILPIVCKDPDAYLETNSHTKYIRNRSLSKQNNLEAKRTIQNTMGTVILQQRIKNVLCVYICVCIKLGNELRFLENSLEELSNCSSAAST